VPLFLPTIHTSRSQKTSRVRPQNLLRFLLNLRTRLSRKPSQKHHYGRTPHPLLLLPRALSRTDIERRRKVSFAPRSAPPIVNYRGTAKAKDPPPPPPPRRGRQASSGGKLGADLYRNVLPPISRSTISEPQTLFEANAAYSSPSSKHVSTNSPTKVSPPLTSRPALRRKPSFLVDVIYPRIFLKDEPSDIPTNPRSEAAKSKASPPLSPIK